MAGDTTVVQRLRRDVAPLGWIVGNLLFWVVMAIGETTTPMWLLIGIPVVPVAIGHICQYALAEKRSQLRSSPTRRQGLGLRAEPPLALRSVDHRGIVVSAAGNVINALALAADVTLDDALARWRAARGP